MMVNQSNCSIRIESTWWCKLPCCRHLTLSLRWRFVSENQSKSDEWTIFQQWAQMNNNWTTDNYFVSYMWMWTLRMVWLRQLCSLILCLPIAHKWQPNEKTNEWRGYLCMWTVRIVWLRLLCSFMLCVPIARFFKPSSNTANRSSSSAHSILETDILDKI